MRFWLEEKRDGSEENLPEGSNENLFLLVFGMDVCCPQFPEELDEQGLIDALELEYREVPTDKVFNSFNLAG